MKSLGSTCSRLTSEYKKETLLSLSFLLDRIIPAALYFLPVLIIARFGNTEQISTYAIFSSLFTSFISIPVGFTSAIRYYSSLSAGKSEEKYSQSSALVLTLLVSAISIISYFFYYYIYLVDKGYSSSLMLALFAISICCVAPYYSISSYNEGQKEVRMNNVCGIVSVPIFIALTGVFSYWMNVMLACTLAFLLTRFVMLAMIYTGSTIRQETHLFQVNEVKKTFQYGLSIASLFFVQKLVATLILGALSERNVDVAAFQMISIMSMILSLVSNAVFTNIFIKIVKKEKNMPVGIVITLVNSSLIYALVCIFLWYTICVSKNAFISDKSVISTLRDSIGISFIYFFFDMLMTAAFILSRACGDTWRCQLTWCAGMAIFFFTMRNNITIINCMYALILSDLLCITVGAFNILKFNQRKLATNQ